MRISDWSSDVFSSDLYVLLVDWEEIGTQNATFKVYINPLINLVWWGGQILILGTLITAWPLDRKSVVKGKSESVRVDRGGRRIIKHKTDATDRKTSEKRTKRTTTNHNSCNN